ncbi:hypothetical protein [Microbacterium sp. 77mftsu3.1]|uniref:hypothetical protein n=1 Tax=Microbacterium sp. 77mftsu3.1 TaxID=1761802 RepID=UPI000364DCA4|nr:hypothetical protein [Microbacterium sp. 77mftsu3.1]SDH31658.1 hypothetical protein SAMN04488590_3008 [Microbacterium sp. 77mftsu3.1]
MRLLPIPDADGNPTMWINADHLVSVQALTHGGEKGIVLTVELKVDGMPLHRVRLGEYLEKADADAAFARFLDTLQGKAGE